MKGQKFPDFKLITLPPADLKIVRRNNIYKVFDRLRKNYYCLTDEELVRQTFVEWLIRDMGYPPSLMANEIGIKLNDTYKRCDTVVFSSSSHPLMIIEYKSPSVTITQQVFDQIARYNMALNAPFLIVSNGINHFCCLYDKNASTYNFLKEIPNYSFIKDYGSESNEI